MRFYNYNDLGKKEVVAFWRAFVEGVEEELEDTRRSVEKGVDKWGRVYTFRKKQPDQDILAELELLING